MRQWLCILLVSVVTIECCSFELCGFNITAGRTFNEVQGAMGSSAKLKINGVLLVWFGLVWWYREV